MPTRQNCNQAECSGIIHFDLLTVNHPTFDGICDVYTSLQTGTALSVQALDGSAFWEPSSESSSSEFRCAPARCQHRPDGDVFYEFRVDAGALDEAHEGAVEEICL